MNDHISKLLSRLFGGIFFALVFYADLAFAGTTDVNTISRNAIGSSADLPGLLSGGAYALGLLLGVQGILKLKDHAENPSQTPLRTPLIRFLIGGALFALPIVSQAMKETIDAGQTGTFDPSSFSVASAYSSVIGNTLGALGIDISGIMHSIIKGIKETPGLLSGVIYAMGLIAMVAGLLKLKEHVENPDQTPLREGVIRLLVGGSFFAFPTVVTAAASLINGGATGTGVLGGISSALAALSFLFSAYGRDFCSPGTVIGGIFTGNTTMGDSLCNVITHSGAAPAFLGALSYIIGLIMIVWAIFKTRDHVLNPSQVKLSEGVARFAAGGFFLSLPWAIEAVRSTITPIMLSANSLVPITQFNETAMDKCQGLDGAVYCFMADTLGPFHMLLNFFSFTAGILLIMIGISRLIKSAQEGPKGPGGLGTVMTFVIGGSLISYNEFMRAFSTTMFNMPITRVGAELQYTDGMSPDELSHAHTVISAILKFMILVGLVSFIRGLFIVRGVAEGNGQASMMSAITHLVGGALAVNLGPLMNAVQTTLGLNSYGITFS